MKTTIHCINTATLSEKKSILAKMEKNDCVVRAIASAFEIPYDKAHAFVKEEFNRADKKGTHMTALKLSRMNKAFDKKIVQLGEKDENGNIKLTQTYRMHGKTKTGQLTTVTFIEKYPKGVYIVLVRKHAFTIKDGIVHGNGDDASQRRKRIMEAFKVG